MRFLNFGSGTAGSKSILGRTLWRVLRIVGFIVTGALSFGLLPTGLLPGGSQTPSIAPMATALESAAEKADPSYRYRHESRQRAQPTRQEMSFPADGNGHFLINAVVNGEDVRFVVDTGATDVVFGINTAKRLGYDPDTLDFSKKYQTANGLADGAPVTLREIRIGSLSLYEVPATIVRQPLPVALLGNSFLSRLSGHEVRDGRLTMYW
jgi:clan AA aspartic protease (TIGR02281 family)